VLFVCENNFYAIHSPLRDRQAIPSIADFARGYGMPSERVDDGDVREIFAATRRAVDAIRRGEGPRFLECMTYRWREHVGPGEDYDAGYRGRAEAAPWIEHDPVAQEGARLMPAERSAIEAEVEAEIAEAFTFAEESPVPSAAALWADV
jgi:TPP-dependent pyruvate/acetoin dehydrogenase alpha subunit